MSDARSGSPALRPVDAAILEFLADDRVEYAAIIANRVGAHTPYVERRCAVLADRGLLEAVTGEVVFRATDAGKRAVRPGGFPE
ncbi:DUF2250 domain-containing protein [Salarchaeum sp. JOR-1]|uniref:DUF2250 domain-containing protein n=1 Tax=Salarchaeum sp. JOR-1 TaxID=2599399 RepID=UPI001198C75E|nr:DUF2250 domain-containing protein [Salarchaeum sp. JOR-1]QDX41407.1 DUF2250 domain-containing protein [Salarchaeum sp. JOR-1]